MGAMIAIKYDADKVNEIEATSITRGATSVVMEAMGEKDVFTYAEASPITSGVDAIEIFVQVNSNKVQHPAELTTKIADKLAAWKRDSGFQKPINLNIVPVDWHFKIGI